MSSSRIVYIWPTSQTSAHQRPHICVSRWPENALEGCPSTNNEVTSARGMWLQGEKGDFCLSELFKIKMNPYIASKLVFWYMFSKGIRPLRMAAGCWCLPGAPCSLQEGAPLIPKAAPAMHWATLSGRIIHYQLVHLVLHLALFWTALEC